MKKVMEEEQKDENGKKARRQRLNDVRKGRKEETENRYCMKMCKGDKMDIVKGVHDEKSGKEG